MIIAIPVWSGRVSPVFDVARTVLVADLDPQSGELVAQGAHVVNPAGPVATLSKLGVDVLICSAISSTLEAALWAQGVEVIADMCGSPDEIMAALAAGDVSLDRFRSPGSRCRTKRTEKTHRFLGAKGPATSR